MSLNTILWTAVVAVVAVAVANRIPGVAGLVTPAAAAKAA